MKKKNGVSCTILLGVVIADFHMYQCPKHEIDSSLTLLNIEILALAEDTGTGEWIRTDGDCTYEVQGAVGSEVSILGMKMMDMHDTLNLVEKHTVKLVEKNNVLLDIVSQYVNFLL